MQSAKQWSDNCAILRTSFRNDLRLQTAAFSKMLHNTTLDNIQSVSSWNMLMLNLVEVLIRFNELGDMVRIEQAILLYQLLENVNNKAGSVYIGTNDLTALICCTMPGDLLQTRQAVHGDSRNLDPTDSQERIMVAIPAESSTLQQSTFYLSRGFDLLFEKIEVLIPSELGIE